MDRWVKTHVRSSCELEINSEEGVLTFVSHPGASPLYDPLIIDEMLEDRPALCLVKSSSMTSAPKSSGRVAMLSFATTAKYLAQNSRKHIALLKALEDRAKWAVQYDMPYVYPLSLVLLCGRSSRHLRLRAGTIFGLAQ